MCEACEGKALVTDADEGDPIWFDGGLMTLKARPADTGGSVSVVHARVPAGKATPLHVHPEAEETFHVIAGDLVVHVDGRNHEVGTGATSTIRRGVPHAFAVRSSEATLLVVFTPGGGEEFFVEAGEPAASRDLPPPRERDLARFQAAAAKTGLVLLGPPPFDVAHSSAT